MQHPLRLLGAILALALASLLLAGPAAAWRAHDIAHLDAPVAADQHHHHDGDEVVADHHGGGAQDKDEDSDERDGGHDHMPSLTAGLSGLPVAALIIAPPEPSVTPVSEAPRKTPPDRTSPPQIKPPQLG